MGVKYTRNSPQNLIAILERRKREVPLVAAAIVTETVIEAQEIQREFLNKATTSYGEYRYGRGRGGSAGRNDTGTMIDGIGWEVERVSRNRIDGRWGWVKGILDYFVYQEKGIGVPEARSLLDSYVVVREKFIARMRAEFGR